MKESATEHGEVFALPHELQALVSKARERLPPSATCCGRHALEALIERGARAITEVEAPGRHRRLGGLTVGELLQALGHADLDAARDLMRRTRVEQEATLAATQRLHSDIDALGSPGQVFRLENAGEARELFDQLAEAFGKPPVSQSLVVYCVWRGETGVYSAPKVSAAN